jgi:hypothetical protein
MELHARKTDPSTSHKALHKISKNQEKVIRALTVAGINGATCSQMGVSLGMARDSISPMMPKLEKINLAHRSGYQRKTEGHGWQTVWNVGLFEPLPTDRKMERAKARNNLKELLIECYHALPDGELKNKIAGAI